MPGTLTEVLHHGNNYHRRHIAFSGAVAPVDLQRFANDSPYLYNADADQLIRMVSEINESGETYLGWSRFYLEPPADDQRPSLNRGIHG
ncbi:hypothetical protein [Microbacterium sp. NPDC058389]|uniref:hypothetical protein n=1 Tax=Microbacterium sp. NPDC058389 TaxID=3346475 RepID=UPI0036613634